MRRRRTRVTAGADELHSLPRFLSATVKPVAICRFAPHEGPGYFGAYLTAHSIPWRLVKFDEREMLPAAGAISGLGMMGGAMSVNDDLPWIEPLIGLIRDSISMRIPVIGHCLGGQLLAKALGAQVKANPVKEIGWGDVHVVDTEEARSGASLPRSSLITGTARHSRSRRPRSGSGRVRIARIRRSRTATASACNVTSR